MMTIVYVAPDGTVSYTMPHSVYKPEGSIVDGWTKSEPGSNNLGYLSFKDGLVACPTGENKPYQVYAKLPGLTYKPECLGFSVLTCRSSDGFLGEWLANMSPSRNRKAGCMGILKVARASGAV